MFVFELVSNGIRVLSLSIRLFINLAVGYFALEAISLMVGGLPWLYFLFLGGLLESFVLVVQTYVFASLLFCIWKSGLYSDKFYVILLNLLLVTQLIFVFLFFVYFLFCQSCFLL